MIILGVNAYHGDSSACLVAEGKLLCAIDEERIRRIKHWAGLPTESIKWCLEYTGIDIKDVDYIAVSRNPSAHLHKKMLRILTRAPSLSFLKGRLQNAAKIGDIKTDIAKALDLPPSDIRAKLENVEHHRAHLASAFLVSPFDSALCLSVDGFGDFLSAMIGIGQGNQIDISDWVEFPHSLGIFYTAFTQFLGFQKYGDEYKVMGLSAYGEPEHLDKMRKVVKLKNNGLFEIDTSFFLHDKEGVEMVWKNGEPNLGKIYSDKMIEVFGEPRESGGEITERYQNIAASLQAMYEEAFCHILNEACRRTGIDKLALAGGCIQNSLANGKIFENAAIKYVYIPPAAHDSGTAVGAAYWVWNQVLGNRRDFIMESAYWGPEFTGKEIESALNNENLSYEKLSDKEIIKKTAQDISSNKIVGWFQGRSESGPRALGNRSILVDARNPSMKEILNRRIKRREYFRPFAPSVLTECAAEWFEQSIPVPFMEKVYKIRPEKRHLIPAVVHVDGTGRLQTVSEDTNPKYHKLIEEFFRITKVPIVLNTSFNENEPIVNTPSEAINCFKRTKMDVLVLENYYIGRS
jgi:carbamoyltransferase